MKSANFEINAWKESGEIRFSDPPQNLSRVQVSIAFEAITNKLKKELKQNSLLATKDGTLLIVVEYPTSEPWKTKCEISSDGFSNDEILKVLKDINGFYYRLYNPLM